MCSKFIGKEELIHILIKPYFEITVDSHMKFCLLFIHVSPNNNIFKFSRQQSRLLQEQLLLERKKERRKKKKKTQWLKTTQIYYLPVLEAGSLKLVKWGQNQGVIKARVSRGKCIFFFFTFQASRCCLHSSALSILTSSQRTLSFAIFLLSHHSDSILHSSSTFKRPRCCCCCSVVQLCLTLCDPLDSSPDSIDHQMVNTKIRLTIFFAAKEGDDLYGQQK